MTAPDDPCAEDDVGKRAQAEAERYFAARASRATPARAKALLERLGTPGAVRDDDLLDLLEEATEK